MSFLFYYTFYLYFYYIFIFITTCILCYLEYSIKYSLWIASFIIIKYASSFLGFFFFFVFWFSLFVLPYIHLLGAPPPTLNWHGLSQFIPHVAPGWWYLPSVTGQSMCNCSRDTNRNKTIKVSKSTGEFDQREIDSPIFFFC